VTERLHHLLHLGTIARTIGADSEHLEAMRMEATVDGVERRHLLAAGRAPGRPEVDDHHPAAQRGEVEAPAVELRHGQCRRLADGAGGKSRGCGMRENCYR